MRHEMSPITGLCCWAATGAARGRGQGTRPGDAAVSHSGNAMRRAGLASVLPLAALISFGIIPPAAGQVPVGSPIDRIQQPKPPVVSPRGIDLGAPDPGEVPDLPINVRQVEITGATLFGGELNSYVNGLTGRAVSLVQLNAARQAMLLHYRSRGYTLSAVSLSVDKPMGRVRYQVTEGRIAAVRLDGDIGPAGSMVLRFLNRLTEPTVIDSATLERYLLLAQDVPGITVTAVLEPSKEEPGAMTLIAQVSRQIVSGQVAADNRAFSHIGPIQFLGVLDLNALTAWGDKTEVTFYHAFPNSQNFGQVSTEWFLGSSGLKLRLYGGSGVADPTGPLGPPLNFHIRTNVFGAQLNYPLIRSRRQSLNIFAALDALESTVTTEAAGPAAQQSADAIRVLRLGAEFVASDLFVGNDYPATNLLSARLSRGLDILGAHNGSGAPRLRERHDFTAMKFEASRTQTVFVPWDGASVALMGLVTGQWSPDILPPAEQFYLGGLRFTRGYYSGQVPGDKALAATIELQFNTTLDLTSLASRAEVASQFYLFYDYGTTWQNLSADPNAQLSSFGGGVRLQLTKYVELNLEAVDRLTKRPPPSTSDLNGIGLYWRVVGRF